MAAAAPYAESAPPRFLRLAGHPLRWRLLRELAWSDRRAGELCDLAGRGQSLVSYHLRQLRDGGLVSTRRSVADGRDTYYVLDLARCGELLRSAGVSLHPGLAPRPDPQPPGISPGTWHRSRQVRSAKFSRALSTWRNEMFPFPQIAGSRRALGVSRLPDDLPYVDLDDAPTLVARGMRPTQVIERNRPYTQAKALQIYREKQWSGIRSWSFNRRQWRVWCLWDIDPVCEDVQDLDVSHIAVRDAAAEGSSTCDSTVHSAVSARRCHDSKPARTDVCERNPGDVQVEAILQFDHVADRANAEHSVKEDFVREI